jgi:hypothetical protein
MLLYYFPDKATLVSAILQCVAQPLARQFADEVPLGRTLDVGAMQATLQDTLSQGRTASLHAAVARTLGPCGARRGAAPQHRRRDRAGFPGLDRAAPRRTRGRGNCVVIQIERILLLESYGIVTPAPRSTSRRR